VAAAPEAAQEVKYDAIVFDLWNTLVVWQGDDIYRRMSDHTGVEHERFMQAWVDAYDERATGPIEPSVRSVLAKLELDHAHLEGLVSLRTELTRRMLVPRPGAIGVLTELRRRGRKLGLISVCSEEVPILWDETLLAPLIDAPVFSCSVGVAKPDRRIYEIAADRLGLEPSDCLFVDDQPAFAEGAIAAGMDAVLIRQPEGHPRPPGVWEGRTIERLEDVLKL
jgi:putative hydrolase of the HAD superfamily